MHEISSWLDSCMEVGVGRIMVLHALRFKPNMNKLFKFCFRNRCIDLEILLFTDLEAIKGMLRSSFD